MDRRGEFGSLRQKAKAWVDGGGAGIECGLDDLLLVEVGFSDGLAFEHDHQVGHFREQAARIVGCADGHRGVAGFLACAENPTRNFTTVGHQDVDCNPSSFRFRLPVW